MCEFWKLVSFVLSRCFRFLLYISPSCVWSRYDLGFSCFSTTTAGCQWLSALLILQFQEISRSSPHIAGSLLGWSEKGQLLPLPTLCLVNHDRQEVSSFLKVQYFLIAGGTLLIYLGHPVLTALHLTALHFSSNMGRHPDNWCTSKSLSSSCSYSSSR